MLSRSPKYLFGFRRVWKVFGCTALKLLRTKLVEPMPYHSFHSRPWPANHVLGRCTPTVDICVVLLKENKREVIVSCKLSTSNTVFIRELEKLRRQLQGKRLIKIELCVKLSLLRLFHVDQNRRSALSLAWHEWFSCKGKEEKIYCCELALSTKPQT